MVKALVALAAIGVVIIAGEMICRIFIPDRQLRYLPDADALFRLQPEQEGRIPLADGSLSAPIRVDRHGFRVPPSADSSERRLLLLGDSFTLGVGVEAEETFAALLDRALDDEIGVINGGQPGYGIFQMRAVLQRTAPELQPERVVVVIWEGDFVRQPPDRAARESFVRRSRRAGMLKRSVLVTHLYRRVDRLARRVGVEGGAPLAGETDRPRDRDRASEKLLAGLAADLERLREMQALARGAGRGLILVFWPQEGFSPSQPTPGLADRILELLLRFGEQSDVPVLSLRTAWAETPRTQLALPADGHPTALAHCLAARYLLPALARHDLPVRYSIACRPGTGAAFSAVAPSIGDRSEAQDLAEGAKPELPE